MWQALMDWLPDVRVGTFEIRDLVSLVVGSLGAFLAYLAIKLGKEQAKIAERQFQIQEVQAGRQAELKVDWEPDIENHQLRITVTNLGIAPVEITEFMLVIRDIPDDVTVNILDG